MSCKVGDCTCNLAAPVASVEVLLNDYLLTRLASLATRRFRRIANLSKAVNAGDFGAVVAEKNVFVLFNSGAIVSSKQADAIDSTNAIFAAIRSQDKVRSCEKRVRTSSSE